MSVQPLIQSIDYLDLAQLLPGFASNSQTPVVFLDSIRHHAHLGRYSYLCIDPFEQVIFNPSHQHTIDPWQTVKQQLANYPLKTIPNCPPFQGGLAGYFAYDIMREMAGLTAVAGDQPLMALGLFDLVIACDHIKQSACIFSSGLPCQDPNERQVRAKKRLDWCLQQIQQTPHQPAAQTKPHLTTPLISNFNQDEYIAAVKKIKKYILSGDIFQANLSQCFSATLSPNTSPISVYLSGRQLTPAPYSAYIQLADTQVCSFSPECFLRAKQGEIETRPIKGTSARHPDPTQDKLLADQLLISKKDRAENAMIVDLLRNDLSQVSRPHSIKVKAFAQLESYSHVHHLVSVVQGQLSADKTIIDALQACFPGGSITGAPKIRAMQIIEELEQQRRGLYCGSAGFLGFNGCMDTSILIRTISIRENQLCFQAGGAITLQSDPLQEYRESLLKAKPLLNLFTCQQPTELNA